MYLTRTAIAPWICWSFSSRVPSLMGEEDVAWGGEEWQYMLPKRSRWNCSNSSMDEDSPYSKSFSDSLYSGA